MAPWEVPLVPARAAVGVEDSREALVLVDVMQVHQGPLGLGRKRLLGESWSGWFRFRKSTSSTSPS